MLAGFTLFFLVTGFVAPTIICAALFLYWIWRTYETFVLQECWTVFLEEVK